MNNKAILKACGICVGAIALVLVTVVITKSCTNTTDVPAPTVSAAEIADEIIKKDEEDKKEKAMVSTHENAVAPPSGEAMKPPEPKFLDTIIYIGESISLEQANFLKEITLRTELGEAWQVWMRSKVSFLTRVYAADTKIDDSIWLSVYLQPEEKWDDENYVILDFILFPPLGDTSEWSAAIRRFESKTQGKAQFPLAYDMHARNFQKAEILHIAKQVLDIALTPRP